MGTSSDMNDNQKLGLGQSDYSNLFRNHANPLVIFDIEKSQIIDMNKVAFDFFGSGKKMLGSSVIEMHPEKSHEKVNSLYRGLLDSAAEDSVLDVSIPLKTTYDNVVDARVKLFCFNSSDALLGCLSVVNYSNSNKKVPSGQKTAEDSIQDNVLFQKVNFLQSLLNTIPLPVYFKDKHQRYLGCNSAYEEIVGYSEDELVFKKAEDLFAAEFSQKERERDSNLLDHPGEQLYHEKLNFQGHPEREVEIRKATFESEEAGPGGIIGVITDVTARNRSRRNLERINNCFLSFGPDAQENIYRLVELAVELSCGTGAIYYLRSKTDDFAPEIVSYSENINESMLTCPNVNSILYKVLKDDEDYVRIHREVECQHCELSESGECLSLNSCITYAVRSEAEESVLAVVCDHICNVSPEQKKVLELITSAISVEEKRSAAEKELEERKELQRSLEKSERRFRQMAENVNGVFWLFEDDFDNLKFVNSQVVDIFKITPTELQETPWFFLQRLIPEHAAVVKDTMKEVTQGEIVERLARTKDEFGSRWLQFSFSPITNFQGEITQVVGFVRDVSEPVETRHQLEEAHDKLKEKTAQMIQNEKMTALGELTASVAHELNQPLNVIKIIAQSLQRELDRDSFSKEELEEDLNDVVGQVGKMAEIIDHMRVYSRRSDGQQRREVDLNALLEGVFKFVAQQLSNHQIELEKDYEQTLPAVKGDAIRLEQVFMNLVTNARNTLDETDQSEKTIKVRSYRLPSEKSPLELPSVVVAVEDNGPGVPEDIKAKIFEPFFTTREPGKGTGLGLSVSAEVIDEHGGVIELDTRPGGPTVFMVILPSMEAK